MLFWQAKTTLSGNLNAISLSWYRSVAVVMFLLQLVSLLCWALLNVSIFCSFKLLVPFFYNQLWLTFTWIPAVIWLHFLWRGSLTRVISMALDRVWYSQTCQTVWAITFTFWAVYLQLLKLLFHYVKIISSFKLFLNLFPSFTSSPGAFKRAFFYYIYFPFVIASSCHKPIRYVGCIFILLNDNRVICNLVAAVQLAKQITQ